MTDLITVCSETETQITPALLARAFWKMSDIQQAEFFAALAKEISTAGDQTYGYGEMQWCYLKDELKKIPEAQKQYMAMAVWAFDFMPPRDSIY